MKKLFLFFLFTFTVYLFPQEWNNTITTTIGISHFIEMDMFSNNIGNHLVVVNWNGEFQKIFYLNYYLLNRSGSIIRSSQIDIIGPNQGSIEYINISGNNDKIYVVYERNGIIRTKKSTDGGSNWTTYDLNSPAGSGSFNGIDIVFDNITNKLHMVYSRGDFGYPNHITHYYALNTNNQWIDYMQISNYGDEWTNPTVSFSQNKVHISYHEYGAKCRDKYLTQWQDPVTISSTSLIERVHAASSKLLYFYDEPQPDLFVNLYVKNRNLNGASWSSPDLIMEHSDFILLLYLPQIHLIIKRILFMMDRLVQYIENMMVQIGVHHLL